jgi:hypothetical protein
MTDELERISSYLSSGGMFNPELANHDAVRELIIDCRDRIMMLEEEEGVMTEGVEREIYLNVLDQRDAYYDAFKRSVNEIGLLREALDKISKIENKMFGPDWEEIEQAREIANRALGRIR